MAEKIATGDHEAASENDALKTSSLDAVHSPQDDETAGSEPEGVSEKKGFFSGIDWQLVWMVLSIKGLVFVFGAFCYQLLLNERITTWHGYLDVWNRWDAARHVRLVESGYTNVGEFRGDLVGFPLWPWTVGAFRYIFQDTQVTAFILAGLGSIFAALLLHKLTRLDQPESIARNSAWFLLISPTSFFLHINYNESLFIALTLGSFLAARHKNWKLAGVLGSLTCLTRLNGLILVPALAFEALQEYRETRRWQWHWLFIPLMPLGIVPYLLLNRAVAGDYFAFVAMGRDMFQKSLSPPWIGITGLYYTATRGAPSGAMISGVQELVFVILGFVAILLSLRYLRASYTIWLAGNWLLITSVGYILSVPRYTLALFPIFILFAKLAERQVWYTIITVWSLLFMAVFIGQFSRGHWLF